MEKYKENVLELWIRERETLPSPLTEMKGFQMNRMVFRYTKKIQTSIFSHWQEKSAIFVQP